MRPSALGSSALGSSAVAADAPSGSEGWGIEQACIMRRTRFAPADQPAAGGCTRVLVAWWSTPRPQAVFQAATSSHPYRRCNMGWMRCNARSTPRPPACPCKLAQTRDLESRDGFGCSRL